MVWYFVIGIICLFIGLIIGSGIAVTQIHKKLVMCVLLNESYNIPQLPGKFKIEYKE